MRIMQLSEKQKKHLRRLAHPLRPLVMLGNAGLTDGSHIFASSSSPTFPKFVTVDLQGTFTLSRVVVGVPSFGSTKEIDVSVSRDGRMFERVGSHVFPERKEQWCNSRCHRGYIHKNDFRA